MGTSSTVKFKKQNGDVVLSVYQNYDGYIEGVGAQVAGTLKRWAVEGVKESHYNRLLCKDVENVAFHNGVEDLALLYVMDNKGTSYNMYVTNEDDSQEFDYVVAFTTEGIEVSVYGEYFVSEEDGYKPKLRYKGTMEEFIKYVEDLTGKPV